MIGVFVTFDLGPAYDAGRLSQLAAAAVPKFRGLPGLISKTFTLDDETGSAVNFYVWESEEAARRFFSEETLASVARTYGVRPALRYVAIPGRVENAPA
jgi:heme-degrading monooxygenase HmoA